MSKTKKNLIIIGSIVGTFVVLMILFGTLFSLRTISVDYATGIDRVEAYSLEEIVKESKIKKGKNIVFADYDKNEKILEKAFPYARFNIVRVFPSKVIIHVYERTPAFRVLSEDGFWHIYDETLKCLEVVANANINENNNNEVPVLNGVNLKFNQAEGEVLVNTELKDKIDEILDGVYAVEGTPISVMSDISIGFDATNNFEVLTLKIASSGTKIVIQGSDFLREKIAYAVYVYLSETSSDPSYATILDKVQITILNNFDPNNESTKKISLQVLE